MSEVVKPRQSTSLFSWDTSVESIKVSITDSNHLKVEIGDICIMMSAEGSNSALDLARAFGKVEVTETARKTVHV